MIFYILALNKLISCRNLPVDILKLLIHSFALTHLHYALSMSAFSYDLQSRLEKMINHTVRVVYASTLAKRGEGNTNSHELLLFKFLLLTYHNSHFLAATLDFSYLFHNGLLGGTHFFHSWAFMGLDHYSQVYSNRVVMYTLTEHTHIFISRVSQAIAKHDLTL